MLVPLFAFGAECDHNHETFNCVEYVRNYDGDTITFHIPNVHPLLGKKINIRVNGVDTPEIRGKTKCEKDLAKVAKGVVERYLKYAKKITLRNIGRGKYFRVVADVYVDNQSIKDVLIKKKLGYPYDGGTKPKIDWCKMGSI